MPHFQGEPLEDVPDREMSQLCDLIAEELPMSKYTHGFITTCHEWRKINSKYDVSLYRLKNNFESGIFVGVLYSGMRTFCLIPYARKGYEDELQRVLLNTKKIQWDRLPAIHGVLPRHTETIEHVVRSKKYYPKLYADMSLQVLSMEEALNYDITIPNNVYVKRLTLEDIDTIYNMWGHTDVYSIDFIQNSITLSISYGIFRKEDNDLQAWVMHAHYGGIGVLYTKDSVRRCGYAKLLVMLMSKELAKKNIQPFVTILEDNQKSISLFRSLGYKQPCIVKFIDVVKN